MKKKIQKDQGISLIVLVITIIVMIILASAIIISLSNNGIIQNAKNAVNLSNEKHVQEMLEITVALLKQENKLDETNLKEELTKNFNEEVEVTKETDGSYTVGVKETYFTIEDGKIIKGKYDKWDGTSSEPTNMTDNEIHIYKASELKWLQEQVAEGNLFENYTIYLENNLDLGARESVGDTEQEKWKTEANKAVKWTPIGKTTELTLKAKFEGNEHIIKGVYVEETTRFNGIFGRVGNTVQNLSIKNSYIEGINLTGGIVGSTTGDVINCHNVDTTVVLIEGEYNTVGGIIGQSKGNVTNCTNSGNIWAYGNYGGESQCGGIVGHLMIGKAENCMNIGTIFSEGSWIAGIAGAFGRGGSVISCSNSGKVIGVYRVGGITGGIGVNDNDETVTSSIIGKVSKCYNKGEIVGSRYVGGITGMAVINEKIREVSFCYSKGKITGESDIGSIIGNELELATGTNTYNHLYYLSSLNLGAINGVDIAEQNVTSTTKDINTFEEFKTWIAQFE